MKKSYYISFFVMFGIAFLCSKSKSQSLIPICNSVIDPSSCPTSTTVPDYKNVNYSYMIYRDQFVSNAPKLGKGANDPSPSSKIDLNLDVYIPCNNATDRPVVLVPRGCGYDSPIGKSKLLNDEGYRYLLSSLAEKGFVVITYEYRALTRIEEPGFYIDLSPLEGNGNTLDSCAYSAFLNNPSIEDNHYYRCHSCMVNTGEADEAEALYKWMMYLNRQDALAAVGYALNDPNDLGINIDIEKVYIGGISNGGQVSITSAYLDQIDYSNGVVENLIVNYYGQLNELGYASELPSDFEFAAMFSLWGSIHDLSWVDPDDPPAFLIQGSWDEVVPYQSNFIGHGDFGDSSKFFTHGSERLMCELIDNDVDGVLWSVYHGNHGYFIQIDECTPDTVCGFVPSNILRSKIIEYLRLNVLFNVSSTIVQGTSMDYIPCPDLTHDESFDYLMERDNFGNCVSSPDHLPWNMNGLQDYCDCVLIDPPDLNIQNDGTDPGSDRSGSKRIQLYPNPFNEFIEIIGVELSDEIEFVSQQGKICKTKVLKRNWNSVVLDTSELSSGVYLVRLGNKNLKIVKYN